MGSHFCLSREYPVLLIVCVLRARPDEVSPKTPALWVPPKTPSLFLTFPALLFFYSEETEVMYLEKAPCRGSACDRGVPLAFAVRPAGVGLTSAPRTCL